MSLGKTNITTLAAIHFHMSTQQESPHYMPRQELMNAMEEITASRIAIKQATETIESMETRSKKLQEKLDHALEMLNGKPETVAVVPAQGQGRGIDENEPKEG